MSLLRFTISLSQEKIKNDNCVYIVAELCKTSEDYSFTSYVDSIELERIMIPFTTLGDFSNNKTMKNLESFYRKTILTRIDCGYYGKFKKIDNNIFKNEGDL